jgi:hypothetical protein
MTTVNSTTAAQTTAPIPSAPPDWRWRAAQAQASRRAYGRKPPADLDLLVNMAAEFVRGLDAARQSRAPERALAFLAAKYPALHAAWRLHTESDSTVRDHVESLILTGVKPHRAGPRCGLSAAAGLLYARYFFDIETRLDDEVYITRFIMEPAAKAGGLGFLWKRVGWLHGEETLLELWRGGVARDPKGNVGAGRAVRDLTRGTVAIKALLLADGLDPIDHAKLLTTWAKTEAAGAAADERSQPDSDCSIAAMMVQELARGTTYGGPPVPPVGLKHAEPRAQTLRQICGIDPPHDDRHDDFVFPEHEYK